MLSRWPIRYKLFLGIALLLISIGTLAISGVRGSYAYRALARSVSRRATELPVATALAQQVSDLRVTVSRARNLSGFPSHDDQPPVDLQLLRERFRADFGSVQDTLEKYRRQLAGIHPEDQEIGQIRREWDAIDRFDDALAVIDRLNQEEDWMLDPVKVEQLGEQLEQLHSLSAELPSYLQERMQRFGGEVRAQYRTWIVLAWITSVVSALLLLVMLRLFYVWVFRPLQVLIAGSRRVAGGDFHYRIQLPSQDEMGELADAMNDMTGRFREIRDDLDEQVKIRTKQVVRSEQLASVGFLAAGVAHEINNPLATIAWAAEALEERTNDAIQTDDAKPDDEHDPEVTVLRTYLRMIQDEAFRCKQITEKLLDFSRLGDVEHETTDLRELVAGVIEMVAHLGKYKQKHVHLEDGPAAVAPVNPQEIKQVVLNLITNALDSLDANGTVTVRLANSQQHVELIVADDGCGMSEEVCRHLFEPFFTRRRDGQGTGLGLSISYRIVIDHGGHIEAHSDGPGAGSQFRVVLPRFHQQKERDNRRNVA